MGIEQKIENILGQLSVVLPNLEKYEILVQSCGREIAAINQRLDSELRNIYIRIKTVEEEVRKGKDKGSDRTWNLVTILVSSALSAFIAYSLKR